MTGTAATEAEEFERIYNLPVTSIPTNQPVSRTDNSDVVFRNFEGVQPCSRTFPVIMRKAAHDAHSPGHVYLEKKLVIITQSTYLFFAISHRPWSCAGKWGAVVKEVKRMNKKGRPVLVGTTSVEQSEELAQLLGNEGARPSSVLDRLLNRAFAL